MFLLLLMLFLIFNNVYSSPPPPLISRIAFGSCLNQSAPQPIWESILSYSPHLFIFLGDNIYGDIRRPFALFGKERTIGPWKNTERFYPSSYEQMRDAYAKAKANPDYLRLLRNTSVVGTWDDHDFGLNDAGKEFQHKVANQKLMLDFFDEPQDSPRRKQAGVYASYVFGPVGTQIKVILLDTRYHRDPLSSDGGMLGDEQRRWLEKELKAPATALTIIGSSVQVLSNLSATTAPFFSTESWGRFPKERARLFKLISESKREGVIFISGDVHFGEITRYDGAIAYPLYDVTASGLTQAVEKAIPSPLHFLVRFLSWFTPSTMREMGESCRDRSCTYGQPNYGTIEIDWGSQPVSVKLEVRDTNGIPVTAKNFSLSHLQFQETQSNVCTDKGDFQRHCTLEVDLPWLLRYRLAILVFCALAVLLLLSVGIIGVVVFLVLHLHKKKVD